MGVGNLDKFNVMGGCCVRFLRHVPVVYVDYPGPSSLKQIYGTFNRAMLRLVPNLRTYADPLTDSMVEFFSLTQVIESVLLMEKTICC